MLIYEVYLFVLSNLRHYFFANMNEVKIIRAQHLRKRFNELHREFQKQGKPYTMTEICRIISTEPAPRFYVTEEYACRCMNSIRSGQCASRQLRDLYRRYKRTGDIIKAINSPAPSYYLSGIRIYRILIETIRQ